MQSSDAVQAVATALLAGRRLRCRGFLAEGGATEDGCAFVCLDAQDELVRVTEVEEHALDAAGWSIRRTERQDFSAFGAAKAFVSSVGPRAALAAANAVLRAKEARV